MSLTLTTIRAWGKRSWALLGLLAVMAAGSAQAGNVGISVGIHVPGAPVYVTPAPPAHVHHHHHRAPAVVYYPTAPSYGHWVPPRGHGKHFKHHKHKNKHGHKHKHHHRHHHHGHR